MNTSRRTFLKKTTLAAISTAVLPRLMYAAGEQEVLTGIQLYSIRDDMKKDPLGTLKLLAEMGYQHVEHASYSDRKFYGYSVSEFKKILNDLGMTMPSGHTVLGKNHWDASKKDFTDAWKYTIEDAAAAGQQYVISPWLDQSLRQTADDLKRFMEVFNKCGKLCKKAGMKFGYHNHDFEFSQHLDGRTVYDIILQNTDPKLVTQQLDIGNLYTGGANAPDVLKQYPGRFETIHVKEVIADKKDPDKNESTILGKGKVPVKEVIDNARKYGGTRHFIIEQEAYQGLTPLECVKKDLEIMKQWGY
jgi:sugar phosphate isomerase/epimerase